MIFYFSSTGNSKYAAEKIAEMNGDRLVSIGRAMKSNELHYKIGEHEDIGFVTPVYYWGIPDIVYEFLNHVRLDGHGTDRYIYHVVTFGSVTGGANAMLMNALRKNFGLMLSATFAIRMVDNYTPLYDCSNQKKNTEVLAAAEPAIREAAEKIKAREPGEHNYDRGAWALLWPAAQLLYEHERRTRKFSVTDECISCGLCERQCPLNAIRMENGKPVWVKDKCTLCLGCLHRCPKAAIHYGTSEKTVLHGRYLNPNTKPDIL